MDQLNVLTKAAKKAGENFLGEAFSSSPPDLYDKTAAALPEALKSAENLRSDCHVAFAKYLTDVTKHLKEEGYSVIKFSRTDERAFRWLEQLQIRNRRAVK